ncbi:T9SS type B sorting domain-containing protein [Parachryseolinea silvisoli]|uniref:T9SS type B sorting domain-containing protein n=1 Tax=Parachryseolinea silvisoli TaxID=2873601 RepID=UPI002265CA2B|nr:gliding motility-associated C-terminal domain-containing protein [Parachryseolinea silvisoli]MCD9018407.1 gliding motility-associated C-terminal domain-containing protein [Parachryseolinea silvisoli]
MLRNLYLTILLFLLTLASFGQTLPYTGDADPSDGLPALRVDVTLSHPCGGANNGYVVFTVISTSDGAPANLVAVLGSTQNEFNKFIPVGGSYTYYNSGKTLGPSNFGFLITNGPGNDVINTTSTGRLDLVALPAITIADGTNDLTNSDCSNPDGQLQATIGGGSKVLAGGGSFTYTWTSTSTLPGFPLTGTFDGTGTLDLANLLSRPGLPGGDYTLLIEDNYSDCSATKTWTITDPQPIVQTITNAGPLAVCTGEDIEIQLGGSENGVTYEALVNGTPSGHTAPGTGGPITITVPAASFTNGQTLTVRASFALCMPRIMSGSIVITINPLPTITGVSIAPICFGQTSASLVYTGTTASPNQFSLDFDAAANTAGFTDLVNQALTASPLTIAVPAGMPAGTYNAILKVTNSTTTCESNGQAVSIVINALPTITLGTVTPVCINSTSATLPYSATTGSPNRYSITYNAAALTAGFVNVTNATLAAAPGNITLVVPGGAPVGTYNGSITVTNLTTGCVSNPAVPFTVTIIALPTITINPAALACQGDATADLVYTNTTGAPDQYSLDFDAAAQAAGLTDLTNATLNASPILISVPTGIAAGTYNGVLRVRNSVTGCVSDPINYTLTVRPRPTITLSTIAPICFSTTATSVSLPYTATTNSPTLYSIDFNAAANTAGFVDVTGVTLPASPITIPVAANTPAGTYSGSLTVTNGTTTCESIVYPITIVIDALPTITVGTIQPVCIGSTTASIPYSGTTGSPNQYSLDFDAAANTAGFADVTNVTLTAGAITVTIPGTAVVGSYNAALTVRNTTTGCVSAPPVNVTITIIGVPTITLGANPQVCSGSTSANLPYTNTTGAPDQYSIDFNAAAQTAGFADVTNVTLGATPIVIVVPAAGPVGTYTGTLTVRNSVTGCTSATHTITVRILPLPTITLGTIAPICFSTTATSVSLPYTATTNSPTLYSIDFNAAANTAGFVDVTGVTLPASPITIPVAANTPAGTYSGSLTVTNGTTTCESIVYPITIVIDALPTITVGTIQPVCIGSTTASIPYSGTTGSPNQYSLDFDAAANTAGFADVTNVTLTAGAITVTIPGTAVVGSYNAALTVRNTTTGCVSAPPVNVTITIINVPTITLGVNPQVCFGSTSANLPYTNTTGAPDQYSIDFNAAAQTAGFADVTNATLGATPIVISVPPAAPVGTYTGTLTVRNSVTGCTSATQTITVTILPAPTITLGTIQPVCAGTTSASLPYTNTTGTPDEYSIDFNAAANTAGFADVSNVALPVSPITIAVPAGAAPGTYTGTITVRNAAAGCVSATQNISITINTVPTITLTPNAQACQGDAAASLPYTNTTGAPNQYSIDFDAAAQTAGLTDVTNVNLPAGAMSVTLPTNIAAGTYNGVLTVRNSTTNCTSAPINVTITVSPRPTITLGTIAPICFSTTGTTVNVPYSATTGAPTQYSITFSAAAITAGFTNIVNATLPASPIGIAVPPNTPAGTYAATLSVRNLTTTCASQVQNINIVINPSVSITPGTIDPVCLGATSATLPYSGATGTPNRYTLDFDAAANTAGFADITNVVLPAGSITIAIPTTATAGSYTATLTVANSTTTCPSAPMTVTVTILTAPSITLSTTNPSACVSATAGSTTLPYTGTSGSPDRYSLDFNTTANAAGFVDIVDAVLPVSPITIAIPAGVPAGSYTATLTVRNTTVTCGSVPQTITISIVPLPTITLGTNPRPCIGATTANLPFTTTTGNPDLYSITFNAAAQAAGFVNVVDATLPATPGPIAIPIPGTALPNVLYSATLTVRSSVSGCRSTNRNINIQLIDTPTITLGASPTVCRGTTTVNLPYTNPTGTPNRYDIDFDAAAETAGFADVTGATLASGRFVITVPGGAALGVYNGTVTVYRTGAEACPSTAYPFTIEVVDSPTLTVTTPTTVCLGATIAPLSYVTTGSPATLYSITFSAAAQTAGFTNVVDATLPAGGAPIQITIPTTATATNYTATLSVKAGAAGCASPNRSFTIRINALPNVTLGTINPVCQGSSSAILPYSGATGTPNRYSIDFDAAAQGQGFVDITDATLPAAQITIVVPTTAAAGTYNATVTVKNATTGCSSAVKNIQVRILEKPAITILDDASVCVGGPTADLHYTATGSPDQYSIVFSAAAKAAGFTDITNATLTNPIVINVPGTAVVGSYAATIVVRNSVASCVSSPPVPFNVDVITTPTVTVTTAPVICFGDATARIFFTATGSPNQYTLDFDAAAQAAGFTDVTNGGLTNPILVTVPAGVTMGSTYNAVLSVGNSAAGCTSAGIPVTITVQPAVDIVSITDPVTVCQGATTATLTSSLNGSPDFYSIVFDAAAKAEGFVDVTNAPYNTNITINIPVGADAATYNAVVTFRNSTTTCLVDHALEIEILQTPIITPGPDPSACVGATSVNLAYTTNVPVQNYSINFDAAANTAGFADIANVTMPASGPIVVAVSATAAAGIYNATINVTTVNGAVSCTSPDSTFTIELTTAPTITVTDASPDVCLGATTASITYSGTTGTPDQYTLDFDAAAQTAGFVDVAYVTLPASPIAITIPGSAVAGTYNATLKVRRSTGLCESTNYPVTVTILALPTITLTTSTLEACEGDGSVEMAYTGTTGTPATYSIIFNAAAKAAGFADIVGATMMASPIVITFPTTVPADSYNGQLTVSNATCTSSPATITIEVLPEATVDAGAAAAICADQTVTLAGVVGGGATGGTWSGGTGTFAPNNTTLNAVYTPSAAERTAGTVTLTLTTTGPCAVKTDAVTITINPAALVSAGTDQLICAGDTDVTLAGSFPTNSSATTATWSGGTGTFAPDNQTLNAVYTLSAAEITAGGVTLTLTTTDPDGAGPCTALTDQVEISISNGATVNASGPADVCANQVIAVTATFTGTTGVVWTTSGDGTFDDATLANATYTPGAGDIAAATVTLTATTAGPCAPVSDNVVVPIRPAATVNAGPDQTICSDVTDVNLTGTFGGSATGILWTTDGDGVFGNTATPLTSYKIGLQDIARDSVVIYLNAVGTCVMIDTMVVRINAAPIVDAGSPQTVCAGTNTQPLNGTFGGGASSASWTTLTGDGTFDDATKADAIYTPGPNDIAAGFADLIYITNDPVGPCDRASETIRITILNGLDATLAVSANPTPVCMNGSSDISVVNPQLGVSYQLINADSNTPVGGVVTGTGPGTTILLPTGALTATTRFIVRASLTGCATVDFPATPLDVVVQGVINTSFTVTASGPICETGTATIRLGGSENGVTYQLRRNADNSLVGTPVTGTGAPIDLSTGTLTQTTEFNVLASNATCSIELTQRATVTVEKNPDPNLNISVDNNPLCVGGSTDIYIFASQAGVSYQLRNDADNSNIGLPATGNGGTITLNTGPLTVQTTVNILATSGTACPAVELFTVPVIDVKGVVDVTLPIAPADPVICEGGSTMIEITGSETNVEYQLRLDADNSLVGTPLTGNGSVLPLPTGALTATTTFNVLAKNTDPSAECSVQMNNIATVTVEPAVKDRIVSIAAPAPPICVGGKANIRVESSQAGISYQLRNDANDALVGSAVTGTGGDIILATDVLSASTTFNVFASGTQCPGIELTTKVTINVSGTINLALTATAVPVRICEGATSTVQLSGSQSGVSYQLQVGGTLVGSPVLGTGSPLGLVTPVLTTTTVYSVLANNGTCSALLTDTAVVRVNALPIMTTVTPSATAVCPGNSATVLVANSEAAVTYELRRLSDNALVDSRPGNGSNITLNIGTITATTNFVVIGIRTGTSCSRQLSTFTLTLRSASDPACNPVGPNCFVFTVSVDATLTKRPTCDDQADGVIVIHYSGDVSGRYGLSLSGLTTGYLRQDSEFAGTITYTGLSPDDYKFTIADVAGNSCERSISLPLRPTVDAAVSNVIDAVCFGEETGKATFTLTGGNSPYEYSLDGGVTWIGNFVSGNTIDVLPPNGTYNILFRDDASDVCVAEVSVTINAQRPQLQATYTVEPATCDDGGAVTNIAATGGAGSGYSYSMDGGSFQPGNSFTDLVGGTHTLTVSDGTCTRDFSVDVTFPGFVEFDVTVNDADCSNNGLSGHLDVSFPNLGAYEIGITKDAFVEPETYTPITSSGPTDLPYKFENLIVGTYYIYVKTSDALCPTRQGPFTIGGAQAVSYDILTQCNDNVVSLILDNLKGEPGTSFDIRIFRKFGSEMAYASTTARSFSFDNPITYQFIAIPDEYVIRVTQTNMTCGIMAAEEKDYVVREQLGAQVGKRTESYPDIFNGTMEVVNFVGGEVPYEIQIELDSAAVPGQSYQTNWEPVELNSNQRYQKDYDHLPAGRYSVTIRDEGGCEFELIGRVPLDTDIYIPNIFTPNEDGINDLFFIRNLPADNGAKLVISDRWGKQVYSSNAYQNNWDAKDTSDGIYFYRLKIGNGDPLTGWVEVLRGTKP